MSKARKFLEDYSEVFNKKEIPFEQLINNPDWKSQIEGIEDILSSLKYKKEDKILKDALRNAIDRLEKSSGYKYKV